MITTAVIADDTALLALGSGSQAMSRLITDAQQGPGRYVFAPAMCIVSATAERPQLGDHIGALEAIHVIDLGFIDARAAGAAISADVSWGQAHALVAARPSAEWPTGIPVITQVPETYRRHGIQVIELA